MQQPLRVLQVVGQMDRAGAETLLMNLYQRINRKRVQFDFLTHRQEPGDYDAEIVSLGGGVFRLCPMSVSNLLKYPRLLRTFFREYPGYQIVHSHIDAMSAIPLAAAKRAGIPVRIAHSHNTSFPKDGKYPVRLLAKALLPMQATHYFSCSHATACFLFPPSAVQKREYTVLPNAIELSQFAFCDRTRSAIREELGINDSTLAVGHVGRFCRQKNHAKLVRVFATLHRQHPQSILLLVGQGELQQEVRCLCETFELGESVRFLGVRDDVARLMQAFDLLLLPSLYEGFPVVGVEAQAAGLPCLMSDRIDRGASLAGQVGFLPLEADDSLWAQAAQEFAHLPRRNTTGELVEKGFDITRQATFLENFYLGVQGM